MRTTKYTFYLNQRNGFDLGVFFAIQVGLASTIKNFQIKYFYGAL